MKKQGEIEISVLLLRKPLPCNDLQRRGPAPRDVTPLISTTYSYFNYFGILFGISGLCP